MPTTRLAAAALPVWLLGMMLGLWSVSALSTEHYAPSTLATEANQSCDNFPGPTDVTEVLHCECIAGDKVCSLFRSSQPVDATEGSQGIDAMSPFGVRLMMSMGFSAVVDSGRAGLGGIPAGCGSCGGASIPLDTQLPRMSWPRIWCSTWVHDGSLGRGMYSGFDYYVLHTASMIDFRDPNTGVTQRFIKLGGNYIPAPGAKYRYLVTEATATHVTIRQPGGLKLRFEITSYVQNGASNRCRLQYVQDPHGNEIVFTYVEPETNSTPDVMKWGSATDPYGRTTTFDYIVWNGLNVLETVTLPDTRTIKYIYTGDNSRFAHKVEYGVAGVASGIESIWYAGATVKTNEALLSADHYYWQVKLSSAAYGRVRAIQRFDDSYVFARSVTLADGISTTTTWNQNVVSEITRSASKQLISSRQQRLDGSWETAVTYTAPNWLPPTATTLPAADGVPVRVTSVVRDPATDMVTKRIYADNTVEDYEYNAFNQMTRFVDRNGHEETWGYTTTGALETHTVAVGTALEAEESWTSNAKGQVETHTDFNGNVTGYEYYPAMHASQFELSKIILPDGDGQPAGEIEFAYDAFGRVESVIDPKGRPTSFEYDAAGRHIKTTYADTSTEETVYGTGPNSARVLKTIDRNGNETRFTYDATGRVETVARHEGATVTVLSTTTRAFDPDTGLLESVDTDGDVRQYEYDYQNRTIKTTVYPKTGESLDTQNVYNRYRLDKTIDHYGRETTFTYDLMDRILSITAELRPGGATITTSTEYDDDGLVEAAIDGNGNRTEYVYDERDRRQTTIVAVGSPVEAATHTEYDDNSNVVKRIDENGHEWLTTYTVRDQVLASEDPEGGTTEYTYTEDTRVATTTNANGHTTTQEYTTCCGRLWKIIDEQNFFQEFEYDPNGNRTKATDEAGRVVNYEYDGLNRQTKQIVDPGGLALSTTTTYDATPGQIGQSTTTENPAGQEITTHVDGFGRTSLIDGDTTKIAYVYDEVIGGGADAGLVKTTVHVDPDNLDLTSASLTDGAGRTIKRLDGFNHPDVFTYDANGNTLTVTDRDGKITTNTYDERDRLTTNEADTGGIAALTQYQYDDASNLLQITDAEGKVTKYTYDDATRRLTTTYAFGTADARTWTTTYTPLGQVETFTKPNGIVIEHGYDDRELLATREYKQGITSLGTDTFSYHPNRLLATAHGGLYNTDLDRSDLNDDYDQANRLVEERLDIGAGDKTVAYSYTPDSLVADVTYPGGTVAARTYNAHRLLNEVTINTVTQASHAYDTADRRHTRAFVNDTATTWGYDVDSRITSIAHATTGVTPTTFQAWDYRYSDAGNPLVQDDVTPSLSVHGEAYAYDGMHRLVDYKRGSVTGNTVPTPTSYQDWDLSKVGDWDEWDVNSSVETRTHNNIHALTSRSTVANPQTYDQNFNQNDDGATYKLEYDANDKLAVVRNRGTNANIAEYRYDALGRRIEKNVGGTVTRYYHAGQQIIEERNGTDAVTAFYTYGTYIDEPLTMDRGGDRHYYHQNRVYSTYVLTDDTGAVEERYAYTAYGVLTTYDAAYANPEATPRLGNPYTFTGRELDSETLLMYFRERIYDSVEGRFKQIDPRGFIDGMALYRGYFVPGKADPLGLMIVMMPFDPPPMPPFAGDNDTHPLISNVCCACRSGSGVSLKTARVDFRHYKEKGINEVMHMACKLSCGFETRWDTWGWLGWQGESKHVGSALGRCPVKSGPRVCLALEKLLLVPAKTKHPVAFPLGLVEACMGSRPDPKCEGPKCDRFGRCEEDSSWGNVCCVYRHKLAGTIDRLDTVCHHSIQAPIAECCDETWPGYDLIDNYAGLCGPDGWD